MLTNRYRRTEVESERSLHPTGPRNGIPPLPRERAHAHSTEHSWGWLAGEYRLPSQRAHAQHVDGGT